MSFRRSHKFSSTPCPGQLSFDFLFDLPAAANVEQFALTAQVAAEATPAKVVPIRKPRARKVVVGGAQLSFDLVVVALPEVVAPAAKPETVYEFLRRHGKLKPYTMACLRNSKVARALTDDSLRDDFTQALHIRWTEIEVDPAKDDRQVYQLANLAGVQAVQKAARAHIGCVYVPDTAKRTMAGSEYAALVTTARAPMATDDYADSNLLSVEDEYEDHADADFLATRLAVLDIEVTPKMRAIAECLLLKGIHDVSAIAKTVKLSNKMTLDLMVKLTKAFDAANDRDIFDRQAA